MGTLSKATRADICKEESRIKFDKRLKDLKHKLNKEIEKLVVEVVKSRVKLSDEVLNSRYITRSNRAAVKFKGHTRTETYQIDNTYPIYSNGYNFEVTANEETEAVKKELTDLQAEVSKFESELTTILYGFWTDKQLVENIPEFKKYFSSSSKVGISKELVPMAQIISIRKQLPDFDITKKEKEKRVETLVKKVVKELVKKKAKKK